MSGRILVELKQTKPFAHAADELALNILRTADALQRVMLDALKPHGLSLSGYNVLRILRGSKDAGLPCSEISSRMISADPDVTRLIDRLEKRGWVTRQRDQNDRRVVICRIAPDGLALLKQLDATSNNGLRQTISHLPSTSISSVIDALEAIRDHIDGPLPA